MNIKKLFQIFSKNKNLESLTKESEMDIIFFDKIKNLRFDFCQKMIDEGFKPSKKTINDLENLLLSEVANVSIVGDLMERHSIDAELKFWNNKLNVDKSDSHKHIVSLVSLMEKNGLLTYNLLIKSQNYKCFVNVEDIHETLNQHYSIGKMQADSWIKKVNKGISFSLNFPIAEALRQESGSLKTQDISMFSACLDFESNFNNKMKKSTDIKPGDNLLKLANSQRFDLPFNEILELALEDKKEKRFFEFSKTVDKDDLKLINESMSDDVSMFKYVMSTLPLFILKKEIENKQTTPEQVIKDALKLEDNIGGVPKFKELIAVVLTYYPEAIFQLSQEEANESLKILKETIFSQRIHSEKEKALLDTYLDELKSLYLGKDEVGILDKLKAQNRSSLISNNDYVGLAKSLNAPANLQEILSVLKEDISLLRKSEMDSIQKDSLNTLESTILKSLNVYSSLIELEGSSNHNIVEYIEEPIINMLNVVKELKNETINSQLEGLVNKNKVARLRVA